MLNYAQMSTTPSPSVTGTSSGSQTGSASPSASSNTTMIYYSNNKPPDPPKTNFLVLMSMPTFVLLIFCACYCFNRYNGRPSRRTIKSSQEEKTRM